MSKMKGNLALLQANKASKDGDHTNAEKFYSEAIDNYEKSVADGDSSVTTEENLGSAYLNLGFAMIQQKKYSNAITILKEAISRGYELKEIYLNLGISCLNDNKPADAALHFQKSIELGNTDSGCFYNLGLALRADEKFEDAVKNFEEAKKIKEDDDVITALAYTHCKIIESGCVTQKVEEAFNYFTSLSDSEQKKNKEYGVFIAKNLVTQYLTDNKQTETKNVINKAKIFDIKEDDLLSSLKDLALYKYNNSQKENSLKMLLGLKDVGYQPAIETLSEICMHNNKDDLAIKVLGKDPCGYSDFTDII